MTDSTARIIGAIRSVPPGSVSSYRDIALKAGLLRSEGVEVTEDGQADDSSLRNFRAGSILSP